MLARCDRHNPVPCRRSRRTLVPRAAARAGAACGRWRMADPVAPGTDDRDGLGTRDGATHHQTIETGCTTIRAARGNQKTTGQAGTGGPTQTRIPTQTRTCAPLRSCSPGGRPTTPGRAHCARCPRVSLHRRAFAGTCGRATSAGPRRALPVPAGAGLSRRRAPPPAGGQRAVAGRARRHGGDRCRHPDRVLRFTAVGCSGAGRGTALALRAGAGRWPAGADRGRATHQLSTPVRFL